MTESLIIDGKRFSRANLRENEFETVLLQNWRRLAQEWEIGTWKPLLRSPFGGCRPDAVAVRRDTRAWAVVEFELAAHGAVHYVPQFSKLEAAAYGPSLSTSIARSVPSLDADDIAVMVKQVPPDFLCISDDSSEDLIAACRDYGFRLGIAVPYRGLDGGFGLRVARFPAEYEQPLGARSYSLAIAGELWGGRHVCHLPARFPIGRELQVRWQGELHATRVMELGGSRRVFLPVGYAPRQGRAPALVEVDPLALLFELS